MNDETLFERFKRSVGRAWFVLRGLLIVAASFGGLCCVIGAFGYFFTEEPIEWSERLLIIFGCGVGAALCVGVIKVVSPRNN